MVKGSSNNALNGIFRAKNLGSISSLNEYLAFRTAHGIDTGTYKDIYLGDYFTIQDGTYNAEWMVAHFDYYYNKGASIISPRGILLIPRTYCGETKMNATENTTVGGYKDSLANTTACPAIANALQTVLGSYLISTQKNITNTMTSSIASMCGANSSGATVNKEWVSDRCTLPTEVQLIGATIMSSSLYDVGEACDKLAVFNFINNLEYRRSYIWTRTVCSASSFAGIYADGQIAAAVATSNYKLRPLIYIG